MKFKDFKKEIIKAGKDKTNTLTKREKFIVEIAQQVFEARIKAGLTQSKLAELIRSKQPAIARLEAGKATSLPSNDLLLKITEALGTDLKPPRIMSICSETLMKRTASNQFAKK